MIIVRLVGGLGNQLFQYAAGRYLSVKHGAALKLDVSAYMTDQLRHYGLEHFDIAASIASPMDVLRLYPAEGFRQICATVGGRVGVRAARMLSMLAPRQNDPLARYANYDPNVKTEPLLLGRVVAQRFFHFDPEFLTCQDDVYLVGFWVSPKFFRDIDATIRRELSVKTAPADKNRQLAMQIARSDSVSLHIRRGDKVKDPLYEATDVQYCVRAISYMRSRLKNPTFYVFSDDVVWAREHFSTDRQCVIVDQNAPLYDYEDLRLMSLCKHNIIAESSFSWWGAWLNNNPTKIVVSPPARRWINRGNYDTKDILPPDWVILE